MMESRKSKVGAAGIAALALSMAAVLAPSPAMAGGVECGQATLTGKWPNIDGDIIHTCGVSGNGAVVTYTVNCLVGNVTVQEDWRSSQSRQIAFDCPFPGARSTTSVTFSIDPN